MAISLVQTATGGVAFASSYTTQFTTQNTTAGNTIIVFCGEQQTAVTAVSDDNSNTYTKISGASGNGNTTGIDLWYAFNITGGIKNTITITTGTTSQRQNSVIREYSGLTTTDPFDVASVFNNGVTTTPTSNATATTAQANELVVGIAGNSNGTFSLGTGYSNLQASNGQVSGWVFAEDKIVSSTGTQTATFGTNTTGGTVVGVATFKAAAGITTSTSSSTSTSISSTSSSTSTSSTSSSTSISSTSSSTSVSISSSTSSTSSSVSTSVSTSSTSSSISTSSTSSSTSISSTSSSTSTTVSSTSSSTSHSTSSTSSSTSISISTSSTSSSTSASTSFSTSMSISSTSSSTSSTTTLPMAHPQGAGNIFKTPITGKSGIDKPRGFSMPYRLSRTSQDGLKQVLVDDSVALVDDASASVGSPTTIEVTIRIDGRIDKPTGR